MFYVAQWEDRHLNNSSMITGSATCQHIKLMRLAPRLKYSRIDWGSSSNDSAGRESQLNKCVCGIGKS